MSYSINFNGADANLFFAYAKLISHLCTNTGSNQLIQLAYVPPLGNMIVYFSNEHNFTVKGRKGREMSHCDTKRLYLGLYLNIT